MKRIFFAALFLGAASLGQYTQDGAMILPKDYREWVFLTSGLGMTYGPAGTADGGGNPRFDNVFVNPAAYKAFLQTGTWPDKTVLILEVRGSDSKVSINTGGRVQTGTVAVEAHVKDTARFPGGWSFFGFQGGSDRGKQFPTTEACYSCHAQNGAVDTTFVQFYPTLAEVAKLKGTLKDVK
jgi:cytochrome P460